MELPYAPLPSAPRRPARKLIGSLVRLWNARMLGYKGPAQPSPTIGDALNGG
jgi:hypothetical protein